MGIGSMYKQDYELSNQLFPSSVKRTVRYVTISFIDTFPN